ncbi:carbohydrate-binding domain-containing protein [Candidatus Saccharibacteria bacterium]|nr:carbohydrate-binding domain-containing protein [Candidatus Saccharibacteria bacterium]
MVEPTKTTDVVNVENDKFRTKKIIAIVGACILAAGIAIGGVYLLTRHNADEQETTPQETAIAGENADGSIMLQNGKNKIAAGGTYTFTGATTNGKIVVDTTEQVKIILNSVTIENPDGAAIKCGEGSNVTIELVGDNDISSTDEGSADDSPAGAISSDGDLTLTGTGSAKITSNGDGIHADGILIIDNGTYTIIASEGLEATYVKINGGTLNITASDDGINASRKSDNYAITIEINGGDITINMGQGDTDAIDSNGDLYINGGTLNITAQSPFDYDGSAKYTSGTMIVNGKETTEITNQFMGGGMMGSASGVPGSQNAPDGQPQQTQKTMRQSASR